MRPTLVGIKKKTERRERAREMKAEVAANVEKAIEKELLERLKNGVYGEIYNTNPEAYQKALEQVEEEEGRCSLWRVVMMRRRWRMRMSSRKYDFYFAMFHLNLPT